MDRRLASSARELWRFIASVAAALTVIGILIVAGGSTGYAPEAAPAGMFALVWAVICGVVAAVVRARASRVWIADLASTAVGSKDFVSAFIVLAGFCALVLALTQPSRFAPAAMVLPGALAAMSWLLARYFSSLTPLELPEAPALARWARVGMWQGILPVLAEIARGYDPNLPGPALVGWIGGVTVIAIGANGVRANLGTWLADVDSPLPVADLAMIDVLGSRANPLSSALDSMERFLGVDLRGSWALRVVRNGAEPLAIAAFFVGWLATSFTQVKLHEQGVVERFGRILPGEPLGPGLHVHFPWPIDRVRRESTARVQSVTVGHEGTEAADAGPENVLWARQHESNEFMFLLGDGRDLVTIDGLVRYRIRDFRAYLTANADVPVLLRGLVYAAVTHRTVDRSLDQVLSENLAAFTHDVAAAVQAEADAWNLGVEIIDMTVGGMHPPVVVAAEYEAVVSAQVGRDTLVIGARTEAERQVPAATAAALDATSKASADAAGTVATAKGATEGFRGIRTAYAAEPELFQYRRRLEALESALHGRRMVIVDDRLERDGATLWLTK
jgi:regulator of protease activity HflC (stomatin/prohibitin superfamily)